QNMNPTNSLRDAMNPLRQLGQDIKTDLKKATTLDDAPSSTVAPSSAPVSVPEPSMTLPDTPPVVAQDVVSPAPVAENAKPAAKPRAKKVSAAKTAVAPSQVAVAGEPAAKSSVKAAAKPAASTKAKTVSSAPA